MLEQQPMLFAEPPAPNFSHCERCGIRCRVAPKRNPNANIFVKGDAKTGRFCANCLVVDFLRNCEIGPASALGDWYFDPAKPIPEWQGQDSKRFDPACLREPEVQAQLAAVILAAAKEYGAELTLGEIDWDEVIANWHLPVEPRKRGRRGGRKKPG